MIRIVRTGSENQDFVRLVSLLDADLAVRDGDDHPFYDRYNKVDKIRYAAVAHEQDKCVSCGAIRELIPDLVEIGVDAIHPIQALATGMDAEGLARDFGGKASFCGGVDAQNLLVNGTPADIRKRVMELKRLFPTGLVISPSHEAILPDIPPENVAALFEALQTGKRVYYTTPLIATTSST